jgi:hypothetical protein
MKKMTRKGIITMVSMLLVFVTGAYAREKEINVTPFDAIRTKAVVNIKYTQGAEYRVKVTGTDEQLKSLTVDVKQGVLVIENQDKKKKKRKAVEMEITTPELKALCVGGVTEFTAGRMKADSFLLQTGGISTFHCEELECKQFTSKTSGVSSQTGTVKGDAATYTCSGVGNSSLNFRVQKLDINCSGTCNATFDFKGDEVDVKGSGTGSIELSVDCKKVKAVSSGVCRLVLSGTADDSEIRSSGVSRVDTSGLNRF